MMDKIDLELLKRKWEELLIKLEKQFGEKPDLQTLIFLVGVQELGQGHKKFEKDEKQDLMHIATCRLLSIYGFYELEGQDEEGWPHWKLVNQLPPLSMKEQNLLLINAMVEYFEEAGFITSE